MDYSKYLEAERNFLAAFDEFCQDKNNIMDIMDNSRLMKQEAARKLLSTKSTNEQLIKIVQRSWIYRPAAAGYLARKNRLVNSLTTEQLKILVDKKVERDWAVSELKKRQVEYVGK